MKLHSWPLSASLLSPFYTSGNNSVDQSVDAALLTDEYGTPVISGPQLLGLFRHFLMQVRHAEIDEAAEPLVTDSQFAKWFGASAEQLSGDGDLDFSDTGTRAMLTIRNLPLQNKDIEKAEVTRSRIAIDRHTGSVKPGAWQVMEQVSATGEQLDFGNQPQSYHVHLIGTEVDVKAFETAFNLFCDGLVSIAANKAQGFGRVKHISLGKVREIAFSIPDAPNGGVFADTNTKELKLFLDAPLMVDPEVRTANYQRSALDIPGSVLKAAVADFGSRATRDFQAEFGAVLERMTFRHGMFAGRERSVPSFATVALDSDDTVHLADFWAIEQSAIPTFEVDFKQPERRALHGSQSDHVNVITTTRTAITPFTNRASDSELFNYQMVSARDSYWQTEITIPADFTEDEREKAHQLFGILKSGAIQIGKMRSLVQAEEVRLTIPSVKAADCVRPGERFRIVINTPTLLLDFPEIKMLHEGKDLATIYREVLSCLFNNLVEGASSNVDWDHFDMLVRHQWSGGARAYRFTRDTEYGYYPFLLTSPGSTFRLKVCDDADIEQLHAALDWAQNCGLPVNMENADWSTCPFVPENGYGEIHLQDDAICLAAEPTRVNANA